MESAQNLLFGLVNFGRVALFASWGECICVQFSLFKWSLGKKRQDVMNFAELLNTIDSWGVLVNLADKMCFSLRLELN